MRCLLSVVLLGLLGSLEGCTDEPQFVRPEGDRQSSETWRADLASALKLGMSKEKVERTLDKHRPGISENLVMSQGQVRYSIADDTTFLLRYRNERLDELNIFCFDELKPLASDDLFPAVRLIHRSTFVGWTFDPTSLIRAVNGLLPLGREKALAALHAYLRLANPMSDRVWPYCLDEQRVFLVSRLLFVRKDGMSEMPSMQIGLAVPRIRPVDSDWPLFPLAVVDDVPFCLSYGYMLAGRAQSPLEHLTYCEQKCVLRNKMMSPSGSPLDAVEHLTSSDYWKRLFSDPSDEILVKSLVRTQAVRSLEHLPNNQAGDYSHNLHPYGVGDTKANENWKHVMATFADRRIHWSGERQEFVAD
jgi:hypothetical protein